MSGCIIGSSDRPPRLSRGNGGRPRVYTGSTGYDCRYFCRAPLLNLSAAIADFVNTMASIEMLDLVVTVDTSAAHLAGAAGPCGCCCPTHLIGIGRSTAVTVPGIRTQRLFRNRAPDWIDATRCVCEALQCDDCIGLDTGWLQLIPAAVA